MGFAQLKAHQHWQIDVSYANVGGTFYYLCSILDGFSRRIANWDVREAMTEADIEIILQGAKEKYPEARPRILSGNRPQFIAKDFKECIRPGTPLCLDDAQRLVRRYLDHYNKRP